MRFGGPLFEDCSTPDKWIAALRNARYSAAYCPVGRNQDDDILLDAQWRVMPPK